MYSIAIKQDGNWIGFLEDMDLDTLTFSTTSAKSKAYKCNTEDEAMCIIDDIVLCNSNCICAYREV